MNDNNINPDENEDKMSFEEYIKSDPNYVEPDDLPSSFLSEEDIQPNDVNMIMIPKFEPNFKLMIENYVEAISQCKNKSELREVAWRLLEVGINHGAMVERRDAMLEMIQNFEIDSKILSGEYVVEYIDGEDLD